MRKVIVYNLVTLDGFFARANGELDWHQTDDEFDSFIAEQFNELDSILLGRITYELFLSFWPTSQAVRDDPTTAEKMNSLEKIVFSTTLDKVEWGTFNNARLVKGDAAEEIRGLKQQGGKHMVIFGSGKLISSLAPSGLIDEYRLLVHPLVLGQGQGQPMFKNIGSQLDLILLNTRMFKSGNVLLTYLPRNGASAG
jgi:dihydrofolate reductase